MSMSMSFGSNKINNHRLTMQSGFILKPLNIMITERIILLTSVGDPDPYVFGLLDLDPLVRGTNPDPSIIKQN